MSEKGTVYRAENKRLMALIGDDLAGCAARMDGQAFDKTRSDMWQIGWRETDEEQRMKAENKRLKEALNMALKQWKAYADVGRGTCIHPGLGDWTQDEDAAYNKACGILRGEKQ